MPYKTLVIPSYAHHEYAGNCLPMAQKAVGAPGGPHSATAAANATRHQHHDRALPGDAPAVVWLSHWGTYTDYRDGQHKYEDWGHVVIWEPTAFGGAGGLFSSRRSGYGVGEWFRTIADIERAFAASYRFWSEDINGVRIIQPVPKHAAPAKPAAQNRKEHNLLMAFYEHAAGKGQGRWLIFGPKFQMELTTQRAADAFAKQLGVTPFVTDGGGWAKFKRVSK
ncbi:hypothetical protein G7068_08270 [Leucobacter viscericola]|uniref:Uncharacterized protein n=1 Tax=Leucobacter viscericola TaxID=2714935 RepID=A0A6G7XF01_9MICO|nr:hypothetical protein [Leucobacter viscericola]QIK63190.1 hypothetical protein G7068_08270 [Leucobacter viscericola]